MRTRWIARRTDRDRGPAALCRKAVAVAVIVAVCHLGLLQTGWAAEEAAGKKEQSSAAAEFGLGTASFFATLPYGLLKVVFGLLGGISGGLTYAFSAGNEKAARSVWDTSLRGTYVITPDHLTGDEAVRFFGVPPEATGGGEPTAPAPASEPAR